MPFPFLHPITAEWFEKKFESPTEPQRLAWPAIAARSNVLVAAPTGSGKTLTAFLVCIDRLVREAVHGSLSDSCQVIYISPLKALASDIRKNLEVPLAEIQALARERGYEFPEIRAMVRTGDTPPSERQRIYRKPPHILVTTPESLYLILTSERGRPLLRSVHTVIVDEIHALARDKRGSHLSLSLERLKALTDQAPTMIGLSATQKPVDEIAAFLVGVDRANPERAQASCHIFDIGHTRHLDLDLMVPASALNTVCSHEQWEEIYQQLAEQIRNHRSTVLFVNTRRMAERVAFRLAEVLGEEQVLCHHGSLSKERRLNAEELLKDGKLKAIVATASLELGIDIGYIDLVCQLGIPFSIATFLQRIGRSGHAIQATPKGRLVPLSRDELVESLALIRSVRSRELDRIEIPSQPIDILAQHLIAESACRSPEHPLTVSEAFHLFSGAWPYRNLRRELFDQVVSMTADGYANGRRRFAYLMWDRTQDRLTAKSGGRLAAITSGGAIPETGDFRVVLEDDGTMVGTVNEDFAIESSAGDIFLLGTHSWKIRHVRGSEVVVQDANGQPPTIPFWLGESPGRTPEFSSAVASLRREVSEQVDVETLADSSWQSVEGLAQARELSCTPFEVAKAWLAEQTGVKDPWPLMQAAHYIGVQKLALGLIPTREKIVFERFFDEAGGMQLVIHSSYGTRINRGWGLALRKRFCRQFDFELQALADDDGIVLSLGPQQSFATESLFKMLTTDNVEHFLVQALLAAPIFGARWRWNATRALAVLRQSGGTRIAPALQRFRSEDLLTSIFPAQTACQENSPGDKEIPDHPLVHQTVHDCLTEAMDIVGLKALFSDIEAGRVELVAKDTREPSPFAYQLLNAYPYSFLDEAPLEERRTRSVAMRPALSAQELQDLEGMDPEAIRVVREQAWPKPKTADEFYEVLVATPAFPLAEAAEFSVHTNTLMNQGRATVIRGVNQGRVFSFLVCAERVSTLYAAYDKVVEEKPVRAVASPLAVPTREIARQEILRGWLDVKGPVTSEELKHTFALENAEDYLGALEATGDLLKCRLDRSQIGYSHWCMRSLLRRVHRLTVEGLRERIRPVSHADYLDFLLEDHGLNLSAETQDRRESAEVLLAAISKLEGFEAPAGVWERELFPGRVPGYETGDLDRLTSGGIVGFGRIQVKKQNPASHSRYRKLTSAMPLSFALRKDWAWICVEDTEPSKPVGLSSAAEDVLSAIRTGGAQFLDEVEASTGLLTAQVEAALGELACEGWITCDHFHSFREILSPAKRERPSRFRKLHKAPPASGRWALLRRSDRNKNREAQLEKWASLLLTRYGIVFRDLLERESLVPSWGELVRVFRRLEARGEVRGGRFISGVAGEQFGLSETHERLLKVRESRADGRRQGHFSVISSSDPLNLVGIVTKDAKIPSSPSTRILWVEGEVAAIARGTEITPLRALSDTHLRALRLMGPFRNRIQPIAKHAESARNAL